jgi:hypothetical protein
MRRAGDPKLPPRPIPANGASERHQVALSRGGPAPRRYGDIVDSEYVHEEIKAVASQARQEIIRARMPQEEDGLLSAIQEFGLAPGSRKMMDLEMEAAQHAQATGLYVSYRYEGSGKHQGEDCIRVGPSHKCFCGHALREHAAKGKRPTLMCEACPCKAFAFVPNRPEEIGEAWLPRRKGFNIHEWSPKCRCGHGSADHRGTRPMPCGKCGCGAFASHFLCFVCDGSWEDHTTIVESEAERASNGKPVGQAYEPLSQNPEFKELVFGAGRVQGRPSLQPAATHGPCTNCGSAPRAGAKFCAKCGIPLQSGLSLRLRQ